MCHPCAGKTAARVQQTKLAEASRQGLLLSRAQSWRLLSKAERGPSGSHRLSTLRHATQQHVLAFAAAAVCQPDAGHAGTGTTTGSNLGKPRLQLLRT